MGVPAFFRWLSRKYPSVIIECVEKKNVDETTGKNIYEDATLPNPNDIEFDNLYLDMNGIIHPCTHPEDKPPPRNEDEMMIAIFECIDRLFSIVRPRKLLYMAIDGVAPRAKMNQQRSRRFRASKEAAEKAAEISRIREELKMKGAILPPEKPKGDHFDSNCITPGTPFMERLSRCLQYYVYDRLNNNPGWRNVKVILSDANVPGEGEHKIMDYIRRQRAQPDHDPNTQHVLCGADADLIMLGLATHEPNFTIIREEFLPNKPRPCDICQQIGHEMKDCTGLEIEFHTQPEKEFGKETQFIFVRLNVLKEYLSRELDMPNLPFPYDFERVIDDWVFMCFFVGNDFLPHLPSLEIRENAIDRLITLYKKCVYKTGGYLTDSGDVSLERVEMIMRDLGHVEDEIFRDRQKNEERMKARNKRMKSERQQRPNFNLMQNTQFAPTPLGRGVAPAAIVNPKDDILRISRAAMMHTDAKAGNSNAAFESMLHSSTTANNEGRQGVKRKAEDQPASVEEEDDQAHDEVRLWEDGFKDRYYESKFDVMPDNLQFRYSVALEYVKGLCWVLQYYYQGCASWEWYFPYHYAPFASDFTNIRGLSKKFSKGTPFKPLEQLMGVFPAASRQHVPLPFAKLMLDPKSPIIDFYPDDFNIDLNGKKFAWQGVALLPFVDEKRLFKAVEPYRKELTLEENKRNKLGDDRLYLGRGSRGYQLLKKFYETETDFDIEFPISIEGMQGLVLLSDENIPEGGTFPTLIMGLHDITDNSVINVRYRDPKYPESFIFPARKLPTAIDPPKVLKQGVDQGNPHYRPVIGFNHNRTQFASVGDAGARTVNHYTSNRFADKGSDRNNSQGQSGNSYQQNRQGFGYQQQRFDNRQGQQGRQDNQRRYNNVRPPANNYQQRDGYQQQQQQRNSYQSNATSSASYRPQQQSNTSGGYQQWKSQRGGFQNQRGGYSGQQANRGGYQRFNSSNNNSDNSSSNRYGGSYSGE
ncbi:CLUMA_CG016524, isoform C [Clunio marinus]|uniref:5'-3' exoribonuclease n=1 Tax=Clunio marinus TaxID=568069 RepID=A0A1J1ITU8_9DIPT|nr:CLUMA_CG016524, isoform C [Clunio marinus]